jgi:hypothetical protein
MKPVSVKSVDRISIVAAIKCLGKLALSQV